MRFSPDKRLLKPSDYKSVFDQVVLKASTNNFLLLARNNYKSTARLGIIVSKKHVRFAVQRNQIKRLIRETFRTLDNLPILDIVVLMRCKQDKRENTEIRQDLMVLWRRLYEQNIRYLEKQHTDSNVKANQNEVRH